MLCVAPGAVIPRLRIVNANDNGSRLGVHPVLAAIRGSGRGAGVGEYSFPFGGDTGAGAARVRWYVLEYLLYSFVFKAITKAYLRTDS